MAKKFALIKGGIQSLFSKVFSAGALARLEVDAPLAVTLGNWFGMTPSGPVIGGFRVTLADDASDTATFTLPRSQNTAIWFILTSGNTSRVAIIKVAGTADTVEISGGAAFSLGTNSNPDTDGDLNVWIQSSGVLGIKNRTGGNLGISGMYITL